VDADAEEAAEETDALTRKDYDFLKKISPNTLTILHGFAEPAIRDCESGTSFQFVRVGYFCKDPDSTAELPVFNRTVELNGMKL
jgi:glutaminyl-tRNA synthetase